MNHGNHKYCWNDAVVSGSLLPVSFIYLFHLQNNLLLHFKNNID